MTEAGHGDEVNRSRYHRINPNIREDPPKLDETKKLPHLQQRMIRVMKEKYFQNQIGEVARRLVASSFYVEAPAKPASVHGLDTSVSGMNKPCCYGNVELTSFCSCYPMPVSLG